MYGAMPEITARVHSLEWALIASYAGGIIPEKHRLVQATSVLNPTKFNIEIFDQAKATQPMSAVIAIEKGCHNEYGLAVFFQQEERRCLLVETLTGNYSDSEAFWYTMMMWAKFQPRSATPRSEPGQLYYPAAATHIIQKYWDYLNDPVTHQDCDESEFTKTAMAHFAGVLSSMTLSEFEPMVDAEAPDKSCRIATQTYHGGSRSKMREIFGDSAEKAQTLV
jgi:hypothetical protein